MAALRADRYGLAISNLHYLNPDVEMPVALAAQEGGPFYAATRDDLISRNYPLTRTIFACANQRPGQALDPKVCDFLRYHPQPGRTAGRYQGPGIISRSPPALAGGPSSENSRESIRADRTPAPSPCSGWPAALVDFAMGS